MPALTPQPHPPATAGTLECDCGFTLSWPPSDPIEVSMMRRFFDDHARKCRVATDGFTDVANLLSVCDRIDAEARREPHRDGGVLSTSLIRHLLAGEPFDSHTGHPDRYR